MEGFETCRDDTDFKARNWVRNTGGVPSIFAPATTTVGSVGLTRLSGYTDGAGAITVSTSADTGIVATGVTVNQAYVAGGFTFGASGTFYAGGVRAVNSSAGAGARICYDGTNYWSLVQNASGTWQICTSPDLKTWTAVSAQTPVTATSATAMTFSYMGSGTVMVVPSVSSANFAVYFTSNGGTSWSTQTIATGSAAVVYGAGCATGNATYPHVVTIGNSNSGSAVTGVYVGTLGGTMTLVTPGGQYSGTTVFVPRVINGYIYAHNGASGFFSAQASNASLNTTGAWTSWSSTMTGIVDLLYLQSANVFVGASTSLSPYIFTIPNTGGSGTPVPPTTGAKTSVYTTVGIAGLVASSTGSAVVGFPASASTFTCVTSTSAASGSWTNVTKILNGTSYAFSQAFLDGTNQIVGMGNPGATSTNQLLVSTSDGTNSWQVRYASGFTPGASGGFSGLGLISTTAAPANNTQMTINTGCALVNCSAPSGGNSTVSLYTASSQNTAAATSVQSISNLTHYYEMRGVAVGGTTNSFTISWYIDGTLIGTVGNVAFGTGTSDTTSPLVITLPRSGCFQQVDDFYLTLDDGTNLVGPLGPTNIVTRRPTADVQAQWTRSGTAASNALSVNQPALSSQSTNNVNTYTDGAKDIYSSTDTVPSNYKIKAVQVEAFFTKTSTVAPVVNVGVKSGSVEVDSANVTINGTNTLVSAILQNDPNTGTAWTQTGANNSQIVLNKVS